MRDPKVLVLDEPTESLTAAETEVLFARIQKIVATGAAVVYISHRLPEVKRIATRLSVLRDGEMRGTFDAAEVSEEQILQLIVGRSIERAFPDKRPLDAPPAEPLLTVDDFSGGRFHDVGFTVGVGEIVGLAGVEGNGQRDALRALAGIESSRGDVRVRGAAVSVQRPAPGPGRRHRLPPRRPPRGGSLPRPVGAREHLAAVARQSHLQARSTWRARRPRHQAWVSRSVRSIGAPSRGAARSIHRSI